MSSSSAPHRRWFRRLSVLAVLLTAVVAGVMLLRLEVASLDRLDDTVAATLPMVSVLRLLLVALLYLAWPRLLQTLSQRRLLHPNKAQQWLAARHRLLLMLVALELLVGLNVLNHLHALLRGLIA